MVARLDGLMVSVGVSGFNSCSMLTSDLKMDILVSTLPGTWWYCVSGLAG